MEFVNSLIKIGRIKQRKFQYLKAFHILSIIMFKTSTEIS